MDPKLKAYPFILLVLVLAFTTLSMASDVGYEPGQIIAKFSPEVQKAAVEKQNGVMSLGIASLDRRMERYRVRQIRQLFPHKHSELGFIYQFDFDPRYNAKAVACDFAEDEHLLYAEPRYCYKICEAPNDYYYQIGFQWYLDKVQGPEAWNITHGDSGVVIGIVDTGVDWDHPDLEDNIWINLGEDINGDGLITAIDWNDADDDSNGLVDDFRGWDFGGLGLPDNNPMESAAIHGTHIAGIASAMTDNGIGVAGMAWDCSIMAVKASEDDVASIQYGYEGIQYAADNGAEVINLGWSSGHSPSVFEQEIIDSAFAQGAILVAAAGNDPPSAPPDTCPLSYPAFYSHVTAVAATDLSDKVPSWTYYGSWVDVAAPGLSIYNAWYNDTYIFSQGTSRACAVVSGVVGLLKSVEPDLTNDEFEEKMRYTSDNIYSLNPVYEGWLGGGRVNAHTALLSLTEPRLVLDQESIIDDASGNGDGRPDPGETVDWIVTLHNTPAWQTAQDVGVKVFTPDEFITFIVDSTGFGNIDPGASADNSVRPFQYSVSDTAEVHWTTFYFQVEANAATYTMLDSLEMRIGRPAVLLVDDDGGDDSEKMYQEDLDSLALKYENWDVALSGKASAEELEHYRVVIWFTGAETESTLTSEDRDHLATFLDAGNKLFLTGQNIGDEIGEEAFFSDYLHVSHVADTVTLYPQLEGVEGDTVSDGTLLFIWDEGGPQESPSGIEAIDGGVDIYFYLDDPGEHAAGTRYESPAGYKTVYFAFGYEGIKEGAGHTSRQVMLGRILNWFAVSPAAVSGLAATLADSVIHLSWSPVTEDEQGHPIVVDYYTVYRLANPTFSSGPGDSISSTMETSYDDSTPALKDPATNHYYVVKAVDSAGRKSADSNMVGEFDIELVNSPATRDGKITVGLDRRSPSNVQGGKARFSCLKKK